VIDAAFGAPSALTPDTGSGHTTTPTEGLTEGLGREVGLALAVTLGLALALGLEVELALGEDVALAEGDGLSVGSSEGDSDGL